MKKSIFMFLFVLLSLTSCYRDIDFDSHRDEEIANMLTLNSLVNPDSTVSVSATRPYFFTDEHSGRVPVAGLDLQLWVDGVLSERMDYDVAKGLYRSTHRPAEGERLEIRTEHRGNPIAATDVVPRRVEIEDIRIERQGPIHIYWDKDYRFTYRITFTDLPGEENYYFLQYDATSLHSGVPMGQRDFTHEYVFQKLAQEINGTLPGWEPYTPYGLPFSDRGIDGERHTLVVKEVVQNSGLDLTRFDKMHRKFQLYAISKAYYDYLVSILYNKDDDSVHGGLIDIGIADPVKYFSNVEGGVGIFASYVLSEREVDVFAVTGSFPE